ncbi:MAG: GH3 auxin-responsive promoter family protein [Flavobacteriales bacterium]
MSLKSFAAKLFARYEIARIRRWAANPIVEQQKTFQSLLLALKGSAFAKDHHLYIGLNYDDWKTRVPIRDYEGLKSYVERIKSGEENVLIKGRPQYFCKTSGTTSGTKYIPMSSDGISAQTRAARSALLCYINETGNADFVSGKMIFLQGSPVMESVNGVQVGRLSGIVAHHVPKYLQRNRMPSWETNCMDNWEEKVDAIVDETKYADMRLISGIPPWVQMYFERLIKETGKKTIREVFPRFSVFAHGGVNYQPYKPLMKRLIGDDVDSIETYPASEGFIAFQDSQKEAGMLLNLDGGIFYEFVPVAELYSEFQTRISLKDVKLEVNYAIILNTSSGLWGYLIGDTVKFVSTSPYRIMVTGRIAHFISAFGEHVIAEEVENSMSNACKKFDVEVSEFHVAPQVNPLDGLPYHEWFVESDGTLGEDFAASLDEELRNANSYYNDLIVGSVLQPLKLKLLPKGAFNKYMESIGKLGGQNKLPRLANDRKIADELAKKP